MVDLNVLEIELKRARHARVAAQIATSDVELMIWQVQHLEEARPRLALFVAGLEQAAAE